LRTSPSVLRTSARDDVVRSLFVVARVEYGAPLLVSRRCANSRCEEFRPYQGFWDRAAGRDGRADSIWSAPSRRSEDGPLAAVDPRTANGSNAAGAAIQSRLVNWRSRPIPLKNATLKCCCAPRHLSMLGYVWQSEVSA